MGLRSSAECFHRWFGGQRVSQHTCVHGSVELFHGVRFICARMHPWPLGSHVWDCGIRGVVLGRPPCRVLRLTLCGPSCRGGHLHLCKHLRWAASLVWAASHCSSSPSLRLCGQHRLGEQLHAYPPADVSALSLGVLVWYSPVWAVITRIIQVWAASR